MNTTRLHDGMESAIPGHHYYVLPQPGTISLLRYLRGPLSRLSPGRGPLAEDTRGLTDSLASPLASPYLPTGLPNTTGRKLPRLGQEVSCTVAAGVRRAALL